MQTFDQALLHHVKAGRVAMDDAIQAASSPHDFKLLVAGDGRTATSMDDLAHTPRDHDAPAPAPAPPVAEPAPVVASGHSNGAPSNGRPSSPPPGLLG
jgi:twitching motility protein PilT